MSPRCPLIPLLLVALLLAACGAEEAESPEQAVRNMMRARRTGDEDLYLASIHTTDADYHEALFLAEAAAIEFGREMRETYGEQVSAQRIFVPTPEQLSDLKVKVEGDRARVTTPLGKTFKLLRVEEAWKVDLSGQVPKKPEARAAALRDAKMQIKSYRKVTDRIGEAGATFESIEQALVRQRFKAAEDARREAARNEQ